MRPEALGRLPIRRVREANAYLPAEGLEAQRTHLPGFHPHELRHTAASLAIASGADINVVQLMLGHKSATMTWNLYGHLFPNRLQEVAETLDKGGPAWHVHNLYTGGGEGLPAGRLDRYNS